MPAFLALVALLSLTAYLEQRRAQDEALRAYALRRLARAAR